MATKRIGSSGWTGSPKPGSKKKAVNVLSTQSIVQEKRQKYDNVDSKYQIYQGRDNSRSRNSIYSIATPSLYSKRGSDVGMNNRNKKRLAHMYKNNADVYANQRKNERERKRSYKKQASSIINKPLIYNIEKEEHELDRVIVSSHVKNLAPPKHLLIKPKDKNDIIRIEESDSEDDGDSDEETPAENKHANFNEADHVLQKRALSASMKEPQVVSLKQEESEFDHSPHVTKSNIQQALKSHAQNPRLYTRSALSSNMDMGYYETPKVDLSEVDPFTGVKRSKKQNNYDLSVHEGHALKTQSHAKIPDLDPYVQVIKTRSKDKSFWEEEEEGQHDDLVRDPFAVDQKGEHDLSLSLAKHMNLPEKPANEKNMRSHEVKSLEVQFHDLEIDNDIETLVAEIFANPEKTHDIERSHLSKLERHYESSRKQEKLREQLELEQDMSQMREAYLRSMASYDQDDDDEEIEDDDMDFLGDY